MNNIIAFLVVFLSCLVSPSSCDPETDSLISRICHPTLDPELCSYVLKRNTGSKKTSLVDLTKLTLDVGVDFGDFAGNEVIRKLPVRNEAEKLVNEQCQWAYQGVVASLKIARSDADRGEFRAMLGPLQSTAKPLEFCETHLGKDVEEANRKMRLLISIAFIESSQLG